MFAFFFAGTDCCKRFTVSGTQWHLRSGGGGGWGDPYERDLQAVPDGAVQRYVSQESAGKDYGVVIRNDGGLFAVDETATLNLLTQRRSQ